jgi:CheY-like chemotaxis protein
MTSESTDKLVHIRRRALVADDDDDMRSLLVTLLQRVGFEVIEASDGEELLSRFWDLQADGGSRLLVVSDIDMPRCDGIEATRRLRRSAPNVPVILLTAFSDLATQRAASAAGATRVMLKPLHGGALGREALLTFDLGNALQRSPFDVEPNMP